MLNARCLLLVFVLTAAVCCGGGGSDGGVVQAATALEPTFVPDPSNPGGIGTIGLAASVGEGPGLVTVLVNVTGASDVFGASFDIVFDPAVIEYVTWTAGTLLETGGQQPSYRLSLGPAGRLVVGASRTGGVGGVEVTGTGTLIQLTFRAAAAGASALQVANASLLDSQSPPQSIPGLAWFGGDVVVN